MWNSRGGARGHSHFIAGIVLIPILALLAGEVAFARDLGSVARSYTSELKRTSSFCPTLMD